MALSGLCLGAPPVDAQEPSAAGLWQQIDPDTGKSDGWFLISEHNGTYEGAIVKMFLKPGDPPNPLCTKCVGDQQNAPWLGLTAGGINEAYLQRLREITIFRSDEGSSGD